MITLCNSTYCSILSKCLWRPYEPREYLMGFHMEVLILGILLRYIIQNNLAWNELTKTVS